MTIRDLIEYELEIHFNGNYNIVYYFYTKQITFDFAIYKNIRKSEIEKFGNYQSKVWDTKDSDYNKFPLKNFFEKNIK